MATIEKRKSKNGLVSYRVKIRLKGFAPVSETFDRRTDAARWLQKTEAAMRQGRYFPEDKAKAKTLTDLIDTYLQDLRVKNPRRVKDVTANFNWWKEHYGYLALAAFSSEHVLQAQYALKARIKLHHKVKDQPNTLGNATVNRYTVALSTALNFGIRKLKWINHNPVVDVDKFPEPPGRTRFLSQDEINRLLVTCRESKNPYLFLIVLIGISTGARLAEIGRMRWEDVSPDGSRITLWKTKNGETRVAHITGAAFKVVQQLRAERTDQIMIFPSPNDPNRTCDFRHAWEHARSKAGIEDFHFHDLRHTCGSYLAMNNANALEIAQVLGHKTLAMVKRYAHLSEHHVSKVTGEMTEKVFGHVEI